jgi:hypothetical protein
MAGESTYKAIIEAIFNSKFTSGAERVDFRRADLVTAAKEVGVELPKNLGDVIYSFRYRKNMPESIQETADEGKAWVIRLAGRGRYRFVQIPEIDLTPNPSVAATKVPDATPGIIARYAFSDEQALLAKVRYNRLVDVFTGVACYSLQNHLRTALAGTGQIETDEVYVGVDKKCVQYVFTVQAKGGSERLAE